MAKEKTTLTQFLTSILVIFSVVILFLSVIGPLLGEKAQGTSSLFVLGSQGLSYISVYQALGMSLFVNIVQMFFMSDLFFKKAMLLWRTVAMFASVFIGCGVLSILFGWFPPSKLIAWVLYLLCFVVMAGASSLLMIIKTRREDARVSRKLEEYKRTKNRHKEE